MSYANGTPFLNLAQTVGTDHRDWFDENEAKLDLDTKMKTLWDGAASTADILATLQEKVASLETDTAALETVVDNHGSSITTINESLVLINAALSALNTQVTNKFDAAGVADPYDATHGIYAIGDVITYNGQRYKCITAVTSAEPFDVSKWSAEDVQSVINQLDGALTSDTVSSIGITTLGNWIDTDIPINSNGLYVIEYMANSGIIHQQLIMGATLRGSSISSPISLLGYPTDVNNILIYVNSDNELQFYVSTQVGVGGLYVQKILEVF